MLASNFRLLSRVAARRPLLASSTPSSSTTIVRHAATAKARPMSPHLTIYKFRINMITSVMFRGTGIVMTGGERPRGGC